MRLTDLAIQRLPVPESGQKTYRDQSLRGFGVRVSQGGSKTFVVMHGQDRRLKTIGRYPRISLKEARIKALAFLGAEQPDNPVTPVSDALRAFFSDAEAKNKPRTVYDYNRLLHKFLPTGNVHDLDRRKLMAIISGLSHVPGEQTHVFTAMRAFLNWCVQNGVLETSPLAGVKRPGVTNHRARILNEDELAVVFNHSFQHPYPFGPIVSLCILTGMRRSEVSHLQADYIYNTTIELPPEITKNNRPHIFPYSTLTTQVLKTLPHDRGYLLRGRADGPFNGWGKSKKRFDSEHVVADYTLHDLRRTFASTHARIGTPIHVVERLLNHVSGSFGSVHGVYNRYSYMDEMTDAVQHYENHLSSLRS